MSGSVGKSLEVLTPATRRHDQLLLAADAGFVTGRNISGAGKGVRPGDRASRREFLQKVAASSMGLAFASDPAHALSKQAVKVSGLSEGKPIKLFACDLNWTRFDKPIQDRPPSAPQDWAFIDPKEYFDWHRDFGNNAILCQAYTFCGYAFYPKPAPRRRSVSTSLIGNRRKPSGLITPC